MRSFVYFVSRVFVCLFFHSRTFGCTLLSLDFFSFLISLFFFAVANHELYESDYTHLTNFALFVWPVMINIINAACARATTSKISVHNEIYNSRITCTMVDGEGRNVLKANTNTNNNENLLVLFDGSR